MSDLEKKELKRAISHCLREIEKKVGWGDSHEWSTQDFEQLSEWIAQDTGTVLSVTTLKRLWGKVKYESSPNTSTLNVLAKFIGASNWRSYRQQLQTPTPSTPNPPPPPVIPTPKRSLPWRWLVLPSIFFLAGLLWYAFSTEEAKQPMNPERFSFRSRPLAKGLPNSVVFEYDASAASGQDKVEIQQNWDPRRRAVLAQEEQVVTSIYYTPGYFEAKLLVNEQIMQEHSVFIPSEGWLGLAEQQPVPIYFSPENIIQQDRVGISVALLQQHQIDPRQNESWVALYRVEDFGDLRINDFIMETAVRNDFGEGASACQKVEVTLLCQGKAIILTLSIPGCAAENRIWVVDELISGETTDLSAFGCDFSDWVPIRWVSREGQLQFYVYDQLAYTVPLPEMDREVLGIRYRFQGAGAVQSLRFANSQGTVFEEDLSTSVPDQ